MKIWMMLYFGSLNPEQELPMFFWKSLESLARKTEANIISKILMTAFFRNKGLFL